ncbi:hypothetical protein [Streptomyces olivaceoviridis]|uniref:hypothetical protein n=1 Tax=Streptomyces olivaceoviridis TaxID=1921 RepID=UPI00331BFC44
MPSRALLVACLRQGLRLARDHHLNDLDRLTGAAFAHTDDSVWELVAPPTPLPTPDSAKQPGSDTPADALAELLDAIARRQHQHRERTAERLTNVPAAGLLSGRLSNLALYYRAHKGLGRTADALDSMGQVADADGRLAPRAPAAWPTWPGYAETT